MIYFSKLICDKMSWYHWEVMSYFHLLPFSTDSHSPSTHMECLFRIWGKWSLLIRTEIWFSECIQSQDAKEHCNHISPTSPFYSFFPDQVSLNFLVWSDYLPMNIILLIVTAVSTVTTANYSHFLSSLILKLSGDWTMINTLNLIIDHWYFV